MNDNTILILPHVNKPVKIVYENLPPCPVIYQLTGKIYRCKYAKSKMDDLDFTFTLYCSANKDECKKIKWDVDKNEL